MIWYFLIPAVCGYLIWRFAKKHFAQIRPAGSIKISIENTRAQKRWLQSKSIELFVQPTDTIKYLKANINKKMRVLVERQRLFLDGKSF